MEPIEVKGGQALNVNFSSDTPEERAEKFGTVAYWCALNCERGWAVSTNAVGGAEIVFFDEDDHDAFVTAMLGEG